MTTPPAKEGTLGFLTYLLVAGATATVFLFGALLVGTDAIQDRIAFPSLGEAITDGTAFTMALVAFFVMVPLLVAGVAGLFGRRGGMSGQSLRGASALNALVGVPVSYVLVAVSFLIASALVGQDGQRSALSAVLDLVVEGFLFMLITLGPLVGFAALVTHVTQKVFAPEHGAGYTHAATHDHAHHQHHHERPAEAHSHAALHGQGHEAAGHVHQLHVDCPRCGTEFVAEGERPLRIVCPSCGKTGTIR